MKEKKTKKLTEKDLMKLEIAEQIGLGDKLRENGWGGLTAAETGRIGGYLTNKNKKDNKGNS